MSVSIVSCLFSLVCALNLIKQSHGTSGKLAKEPEQVWDYVAVRNDAYMFWWLYYTTGAKHFTERPLVMWLQGGPGGSSTGFGNFNEIGPLDVTLKPRNTTWLSAANLLFVDNPVGTGYSFVTNSNAYTHNSHEIAVDLLSTVKTFLKKLPEFQKVPFYIFSESYGGKMTAAFSQELYNAIENKDIRCNFQGLAMGDSWISPLDSVLTWAPYLYATSLVDGVGLAAVESVARECDKAVAGREWTRATQLWSELEDTVSKVTNGVNWYNILQWSAPDTALSHLNPADRQFERHVRVYQNDVLSALMNGPIRDKLKIIPKNVTWGGQSGGVFDALRGDFMKDVVQTVSSLLKTPLKIVVYSGQLDLIVDTMGTEQWIQQLDWPELEKYNQSERKAWYTAGHMAGYVKRYKNLSFYWVLNAGHMVPADQGEAALTMLNDVLKT